VWIAWDHIARVKDALTTQPDQFVAFPAPAGPKGRGYMPVIAGLAAIWYYDSGPEPGEGVDRPAGPSQGEDCCPVPWACARTT